MVNLRRGAARKMAAARRRRTSSYDKEAFEGPSGQITIHLCAFSSQLAHEKRIVKKKETNCFFSKDMKGLIPKLLSQEPSMKHSADVVSLYAELLSSDPSPTSRISWGNPLLGAIQSLRNWNLQQ
ncbi:hypothetical protein RF11_03812 [Thelohanellus kitauei]|uniref:Uncharacterized protein n=1 Tax=Thelohanellus kitauei TaxID=669202 RepID=A0A0C2IU09_THEKT|nr:hypothetical protein RF11_03812 [Thelohanellus kitauei]